MGVSLIVISASSSASVSRRSRPGSASSGSASRPAASSASPSSLRRAQHALRFDAAHRRALDRVAAGQHARLRARRARACRPPHWVRRRRSAAAHRGRRSTVHTRRRSASGCGVTLDDLADDDVRERRRGGARRPRLRGPPSSACRTAPPCRAADRQRAQPVFGEFHASSRELPQEAQVVLVEQPQVVDAVAQHREPIGPHAEREALPALADRCPRRAARSDAPGRQPAISSQPPSPKRMSISADGSVNGKNDGRKRTVMSSRSKKLRRNSVNTPFRSANDTSSVDPQALDLVEHRRMRRVAVDAVDATRRDDLDRRRVRFHVADLDRRRVRAQHHAAFDVERVVHRARRMVLRRVERGEVVEVVLDLRTVGDVEAERAEQRLDALERARDRMQRADAAAAAGQRTRRARRRRAARRASRRRARRGARSSAASSCCLRLVDRAPAAARSAAGSLPSAFSCSVSAPVLPR